MSVFFRVPARLNIVMDPNIRNFKDFLQLYNKISELCFTKCVDNFFSRNVGAEEVACVESCVHKFARFNQKMMGTYVEVQTQINIKRSAEIEAHQQEALNAAKKRQEESNPSLQINADKFPSDSGLVENATV